MKILLVGGGSGGPVVPLIAVAEEIKATHPKAKFLLVGTKTGPEARMAERAVIPFLHIYSGKFRRYFSLKNFFTPFAVVLGFVESWKILNSFKPDCVFGTGSFVQVPMCWAAWIKRVPVVLHQQDFQPSLANKICQLCASKITVTFEENVKSFSSSLGWFYKKSADKVILTGNPFRESLKNGSKEKAIKTFNLKSDLPTLLVLGGGTGSEFLNKLIIDVLPQLSKTVQIIHSTGKGKFTEVQNENYHPYDFIDNMADAYAAADLVLARAGLSTLTELSNLKKLSIIVPMPNSHQEVNAWYIIKHQAAIVLSQNKISLSAFVNFIRKLLFAQEAQDVLKHGMANIMPHGANAKISEVILKLAESYNG